MGSINRAEANIRIARVYDTAVGAQGDQKSMRKHVKAIRDAVGMADPNARGATEFNARFGGKAVKRGR